jgi:KGK domain
MENNSYLHDFDEEDLISFDNREKILRIQKVKDAFKNTFYVQTDYSGKHSQQTGKTAQAFHSDLFETVASGSWLSKGAVCEVLRLGEKQWTKGKIKVTFIVEFIADQEVELPSELDVFRENEEWPPSDP